MKFKLAVRELEHYDAYLIATQRQDTRYKDLAERLQRKVPTREEAKRPATRKTGLNRGSHHERSRARGAEFDKKLLSNIAAFGIDAVSTAGGWGRSLDAVYDQITESIKEITSLLRSAI